jgi:hypothetical protein
MLAGIKQALASASLALALHVTLGRIKQARGSQLQWNVIFVMLAHIRQVLE